MKVVLTAIAAGIVACAATAGAVDLSKGRWIDLTHEFSAETIYWPTSRSFGRETVFEGYTEKGYYYSAYYFATAEHGGTHVDAPIHFVEGRRSVDQIPVEQLVGPAVVVDVTEQATKDRDYQVQVTDFEKWEARYGRLPHGCIVLLNTGSAKYWPDRVRYMGTAERGEEGVKDLHFPGLHPDAARWLVGDRDIGAIGLDTPSIDYGQSTHYESHRILFDKNIPAFENVAHVNMVPAMGATVFAFPMKIKGGSGGPLRIVAFVPEKE